MEAPKKSNRKDIRNFLVVVAAGILCAFIIVFWMIKEDPLERDLGLTEALISPQTIEDMGNRAVRSSASSPQYLVESIDFSYFDPDKGKWEMTQIDIAPYRSIYALLKGDSGTTKPPEGVKSQFNQGTHSSLAIYVRIHEPYKKGSRNTLFQQVQFLSKGDWYRVQLHSDTEKPEWVYFKHPKVQRKLLDIVKQNG